MKKSIIVLLLAVSMIICMTFTVSAADAPLLHDGADLLTESEESSLLARLESLSSDEQMDVVIVTVDSIGSYSAMEYADDYYDNNGYGYGTNRDGLVLLVSMEHGDWHISTCGKAITVFTDAGIEYIGKRFTPQLSDGDYYDALGEFVDQCDAFIEQAKTGNPYDTHNLPKEPFNKVIALIIALVVGFFAAKIYAGKLKKQLNTVKKQDQASGYVKKDGMNITTSNDLFLYRTVSQTAKESNSEKGGSSTHKSSSGTTHGGGGGKF